MEISVKREQWAMLHLSMQRLSQRATIPVCFLSTNYGSANKCDFCSTAL